MTVPMPDDSIPQLLSEMAETLLGSLDDSLRITPLFGDGSDRRFFRLEKGLRRAIGLSSPRKTATGVDENDSYFLIGRHLQQRSLPVPEFLWADPSKGLFILEDLGDVHLQQVVNRRRTSVVTLYRDVIRVLVKLHERAPEGFLREYCFDGPIYDAPFVLERELEYFRKAFLEDMLGPGVADDRGLRMDFERLAARAGVSECSHVIHRDFQSRNLMVRRGRIGLLDFQGMRFGPPAYDLASLLTDPYVALPEPAQATLTELYWQGARRFLGVSRQQFQASYVAVRLCRNLQVLGAYAFLGLVRGKVRFLSYIPSAWRRLGKSLQMAGTATYPHLTRCARDERLHRLINERLGQVLRDNGG